MSLGSETSAEHLVAPSALDIPELRRNLVRILFVHQFAAEAERFLHEVKRMHFTATAELVATPQECVERLRSEVYDIVVAEYPGAGWQETRTLDVLAQMRKDVPIIFVAHNLKRETSADLILKGAADCIETNNLGHLPIAIHRALDEKVLRNQRDRAERDLRRSEAQYRALVGNLNYGICRCGLDGEFLQVNEAMVRMLGYASREELLGLGLARDIIQNHDKREHLLGQSDSKTLVDPLEIEWKRQDHTPLKVRLSGREVLSDRGELEAYEIIAEDITRQRDLEDHLRRQAASDPLTGLSNYRHFVGVLDSEIRRSKRTNREFALLFFDMDELKLINDRYGHIVGSQALCRLADVLCSCCRDIDTAARFGGDEFALVLPEENAKTASLVAQRIRESVSNDGKEPALSISVGVAIYPRDGHTIESLLYAADSELYSMKRQKQSDARRLR